MIRVLLLRHYWQPFGCVQITGTIANQTLDSTPRHGSSSAQMAAKLVGGGSAGHVCDIAVTILLQAMLLQTIFLLYTRIRSSVVQLPPR